MTRKQECEKTFYRELYHFDDRAQSLVIDETTGSLFLRKERERAEERVLVFLRDHRHPHVAYVQSFWEEGGKTVVLEEYIDGATLAARLEKEKLSREEALRILRELCDGLVFLHHAKPPVIHRDLKASNTMLAKDGTVKIIDYDAARIDDGDRTQTKDTVLIGTQGSAAPEQYGFAPSDARTDIYALGVLMKELFPDDDTMQHVIENATKMDPADRYQTVEELLKDVDSKDRPAGGKSARWLAVAAIALAVILAILFLPRLFAPGQPVSSVAEPLPADTSVEAPAGNDTEQDDDDDESKGGQDAVAGEGNGSGDWIQARPLSATRSVTLGGLRLEVPKSWVQNGIYHYAETGTGTTMLMTVLNDQIQFTDEEEFDLLSGEIAEALTLGMTEDDGMQILERENDRITVSDIDMVRSIFSASTGNVMLKGELEIIYDTYSRGAAVLYFLQSEHAGKDFFEDYHVILQSVTRIAVLNGDWIQPADDRKDDPFAAVSGYHIAEITDDTITINWYDEALGIKALFWQGTYEAPPADAASFTWVSYPDEEAMKDISLAPDTETIAFTYEDGVIRYEATVRGETKEVRLVPVE